jgi:lysyl endopeptidase
MKKKCLLFFFINAVFFTNLQAQISKGGMPVSFLYPEVSSRYMQAEVMQFVDADRLREEDAITDTDASIEKILRFGYAMQVDFSINNSGVTDVLPNGDKIWRLAIKSAGANTINLIFSKYYVPLGAQLFIYSADKRHIIGAFTEDNNQMDQKLGTTLVEGEESIIEYYEPSWVSFPGQIAIETVVHGYRLPGEGDDERGFGGAGSCNNNVNCPEGANWTDQKRSVARIVNGGDWCTGALINNTSNDGTPYFLTANHCYTSNYSTWVYWFNYESIGCTNPGTAPTAQTLSGATLVSRNAASDFMLVQLNTTPPTNYNVFYAGWNRSATTATSATCIHHPSGDIKKISFDNNTLTNSSWSGTPANSHWHTIWDDGVTEGGSSGSPLFDQNKRIVGQLHGGASFCGGSDLSDEYGKFSLSWDLGTTTATRLKE